MGGPFRAQRAAHLGAIGFTGNARRARVRSYDPIGIVATVIFQARGLRGPSDRQRSEHRATDSQPQSDPPPDPPSAKG
ncbi:hypothetical protein XFF6990_200461 [Xanthomonas citri pv. fuscans]|uniref:Uncharacterized protein n=1 Tax=Xanthomonas campestris pv. phaseoli TaxID=317013 RepID=A0A7Z7J4G9_XANCH|nr:hypothetical protein XFF6990_200461 [Xanthomonas citri pv. fuscans]SOO25694.1 hypothetical protein XFF6991_480019 [Xanthomonas phaseoli pv. phaseoli]